MGSFRDYRTGNPVEIDTDNVTLVSANEAIDATLLRVDMDGKPKAYLLRDSVDEVTRAFR